MPNTLLLVDGRGFPKPLAERLGALGYICRYARGPLKARALLTQDTVDLILWKDNTASPELSAELLKEWTQHPRIPVVRLFGKGAVMPEGVSPDLFARTVTANLSTDVSEYQLFTTLSRCLNVGLVPAEFRSGNELGFRHVMGDLLEHPVASPPMDRSILLIPDGPDTGLTPTERTLLREANLTKLSEDSVVAKVIKPWWRVWDRWVGPRGDASPS
jgi:hypothetical protein